MSVTLPRRRPRPVFTLTEGWGIIRPDDQVAHYYRDTDALCGRVALYKGHLEPGGTAIATTPHDCIICIAQIEKEKRA